MKKKICSLLISLLLLSCREAADLRDSVEDYLQTSSVNLIDSADESGFSTDNIIVELSCDDSSAEIWYTTDRSTPTYGNGELYTGEITLSGHNTPIVFKAAAVRDDSLDSEVITKDYLIVYDSVPAPEFGVSGGTYSTSQSISLSCSISTATIWYTTDGTSPKSSTTRIEYTSPVLLDRNGETVVINCYAEEDGIPDSDISTATYVLDYDQLSSPTFSPDPGQQNSIISVNLSSSYSGAGIVYTTDGSNPVSSATAKTYTGSISLNWSGYSEITIKAAAVAAGMESSDVSVGYYYLQDAISNSPSLVSQAGFNEHEGTIYTNAASVALEFEAPDSGADIFYTTNGEMPMVEQLDGGAGYTLLTADTKQYDSANPESLTDAISYTINSIAFNGLETASSVYSQILTIDRTVPVFTDSPAIPSSQDSADDSDNITNYSSDFSISGSVDEDVQVELYNGASLVGSLNSTGVISFPAVALTEGSHDLMFRAIDYAGNVATSDVLALTVDRTIPTPEKLDLMAAYDTGVSNIDNQTKEETVRLTCAKESDVDSYYLLIDDAETGDTLSELSGSEVYTDYTMGSDGHYFFKVRVKDIAGNSADSLYALDVKLDSFVSPPTILGLESSCDTGYVDTDGITKLTDLELEGTGEGYSSVTIYRDKKDGNGFQELKTVTSSFSGSWNSELIAMAGEGEFDFKAVQTDFSGNTSGDSTIYSIKVDTSAPAGLTNVRWYPKNSGFQVEWDSIALTDELYAVRAYSNSGIVGTNTNFSETSLTVDSLTNLTEILASAAVEDKAGNVSVSEDIYLTPGVLYVKPLPSGSADGTNWDNCLGDIQEAYDAAQSGMQIWLAGGAGYYYPKSMPSLIPYDSDEAESYHFSPVSGVTLRGGFSGIGDTCEPDLYTTVLSGNNVSLHVIYTDQTYVDGTEICDLTIMEGNAGYDSNPIFLDEGECGGGAYLNGNCNLTFNNVTFQNNDADGAGGAVYIGSVGGSTPPEFFACDFLSNNVSGSNEGKGGAIYIDNTNPVFSGCQILSNYSRDYGGAVYIDRGTPLFENHCTISDNRSINGGGFYIEYSNGSITDCLIERNYASNNTGGGGIFFDNCTMIVKGNTFTENEDYGGTTSSGSNVYSKSSTIDSEDDNTLDPTGTWENGF